jgi:hypothetical protein
VVLKNFAIKDRAHLLASLPVFQFWYNNVLTHQYLGGMLPTCMLAAAIMPRIAINMSKPL